MVLVLSRFVKVRYLLFAIAFLATAKLYSQDSSGTNHGAIRGRNTASHSDDVTKERLQGKIFVK